MICPFCGIEPTPGHIIGTHGKELTDSRRPDTATLEEQATALLIEIDNDD